MRIGDVDLDRRVLVVAEIGNNHEGDPRVATELVHRAAEAGADAVKFQTFVTEHFVSRSDAARFERLKRFELSPDDFARLASVARGDGIGFISTPLDLGSASMLDPLVDAYKIASADNTFYPLLEQVARTGRPIIISTGLADLAGIERTLAFVAARRTSAGRDAGVAVLHCVTAYPVEPADANVRAVATLARALPCPVGYSDHTVGNDAPVLAVALGARIIEKHFTLDKHYSDFRDHRISADPADLRDLVGRIRRAECLLGSGEKRMQPCEASIEQAVRRSIVAAVDRPAGHRLAIEDLTWVRPGGGLPPGEESQLLGRALVRDVVAGERLDGSCVA